MTELVLRRTDIDDPVVRELLSELPWGLNDVGAGPLRPPGGAIVLAADPDGMPLGCCGVRALAGAVGVGEIKRLYVRPVARGRGLARTLLAETERVARELGYLELRLDTHAEGPVHLFRVSGWAEIAPYSRHEWARYWFAKRVGDPSANASSDH